MMGRWLEQSGLSEHTGICKGSPGKLVIFVYNNQISRANQVAEVFAANDNRNHRQDPTAQSEGINDRIARGDEAARQRCLRVFRQQGNIYGFPSCERFGLGSAYNITRNPNSCNWIKDYQQRHKCILMAQGPGPGRIERNVVTDGPSPQSQPGQYDSAYTQRGPFRSSAGQSATRQSTKSRTRPSSSATNSKQLHTYYTGDVLGVIVDWTMSQNANARVITMAGNQKYCKIIINITLRPNSSIPFSYVITHVQYRGRESFTRVPANSDGFKGVFVSSKRAYPETKPQAGCD